MHRDKLEFSDVSLNALSRSRYTEAYNQDNPLLEQDKMPKENSQIANAIDGMQRDIFSSGFIRGAKYIFNINWTADETKLLNGLHNRQEASMPDFSSFKLPEGHEELEKSIIECYKASYKLGFSDGGLYMIEQLKIFYGEIYGLEF